VNPEGKLNLLSAQFRLYFDGGTERKLKINKIDKRLCIVHATWEFIINELDEKNNY
jgi:hypothetical protein